MFVIERELTENKVNLLIPSGDWNFVFTNLLTGKKIEMDLNGVLKGSYATFNINGADIPIGSYLVVVGGIYATKCVCIGENNEFNNKYL